MKVCRSAKYNSVYIVGFSYSFHIPDLRAITISNRPRGNFCRVRDRSKNGITVAVYSAGMHLANAATM